MRKQVVIKNLIGYRRTRIGGKISRSKKKYLYSNKKTRRHRSRTLALAVFLVLVAAVAAAVNVYSTEAPTPEKSSKPENPKPYESLVSNPETSSINAPDPIKLSLSGVAYESVASELAGADPDDVRHVRGSIFDPTWSSVRIPVPGRNDESYYAVFLEKTNETWTAQRSVLVEDQEFPKDVQAVLEVVPKDLVNPLFPSDKAPSPEKRLKNRALQEIKQSTDRKDGWRAENPKSSGEFHTVRVADTKKKKSSTTVYLRDKRGSAPQVVATGRNLTDVEAPKFPKELAKPGILAAPEDVDLGSDEVFLEGDARVSEGGLRGARSIVQDYPGEIGFYALDLETGKGFGSRPDTVFFSASTIKVPVMAAVYRKIESGDLEYSDTHKTTEEDWAAGAGWLRWETPGATTTVEDALWLMMTQSDNVATNLLVRLVGGPEYVDEVAKDLGAKDTVLHWKLSSERAAVPSLDNRTTPRDMAKMLASIKRGDATDKFGTTEMIGLLEQNQLEYWMEAGVPPGIPVANKAGWLDATFNDAGIVEFDDKPYILTIYTKYGPEKVRDGEPTLQELSKAVWQAETGQTLKEYEQDQKTEPKVKPPESKPKRNNGPNSNSS